eukprot:jgi/Tetstr1/435707/TSEL_024606.t1
MRRRRTGPSEAEVTTEEEEEEEEGKGKVHEENPVMEGNHVLALPTIPDSLPDNFRPPECINFHFNNLVVGETALKRRPK